VDPTIRPDWADPGVVFGLVAAGVSLLIDLVYLGRRGESYPGFVLLPNVILIPLGAILLLVGGLAWIRPLQAEWPGLRVVVFGAVLVWAVVACGVPYLGGDVQPVI
jgi:hypothetical protein